jgi:hypothetical protein
LNNRLLLLTGDRNTEGGFTNDWRRVEETVSLGKSISRGEKRKMEAEARGPCFSGASGSNNDGTKPSEKCKAILFQALYEWFKEMPFINLNRNYLALGANVGNEVFVGPMQRLFEDAISGEE